MGRYTLKLFVNRLRNQKSILQIGIEDDNGV